MTSDLSEDIAAARAVPRTLAATGGSIWDGCELPLFGGFVAVSGLVVALVAGAVQLPDAVAKWVLYLTMGMVFVLAIGGATYFRRFGPGRRSLNLLQIALCATVASMAIVYTILAGRYYVLLPAAIQIAITVWRVRSSGSSSSSLFATLLAVPIAWSLATSLVFWVPFNDWVLGSLFSTIVFVVALCLALLNSSRESLKAPSNNFSLLHPWDTAALLLIAFGSLRTLPFNLDNFHHWGVYVGPAQMVHQGGWLLWDVPSQYGFLDILAIVVLPTTTLWQALYVLNGLLIFISTTFLFVVIRSLHTGRSNFWFALAISTGAGLLITGRSEVLAGPQYFPSAGPLRFFWCYALLAVLAAESRPGLCPGPRQRFIWLGHVFWLLGALWSLESAAYCTLIWFPSLIVISSSRDLATGYRGTPFWRAARSSVSVLLAPIGLFVACIVALVGFYVVQLGHIPDWLAYADYALSFGAGTYNVRLDPVGSVGALLLAFSVLVAAAIHVTRANPRSRQLGLLVGSASAVWAMSSYMVPNSSSQQVSNFSPIWCTCLGLALLALQRDRISEDFIRPLRASLLPLFTVLLTAVFANKVALATILSSPLASYTIEMDRRLPLVDTALGDLLGAARVGLEDPIITTELNLVPNRAGENQSLSGPNRQAASTPIAWTPISPLALIVVLPEARRRVYMERFAARTHLSGWLAERAWQDYRDVPWIRDGLLSTYQPTKAYENGYWRLIWFEWSGR